MNTEEQRQAADAEDSKRKLFYIIVAVTIIGAATLAWTNFFVPVSYEVFVEPPTLFTDSEASASMSIFGVSRSGSRVPWSRQRIACEVLEGVNLAVLKYNEDSTMLVIVPTGLPGEMAFRVRSSNWPFSMFVTLRIQTPLALLARRQVTMSES